MTKPLQVYLEDEDLERLEAFARERGWTKSQAIRTAVRALTRQPARIPSRSERRHRRLAARPEQRIRSLSQRDVRCRAARHVPHAPPPDCSSIVARGSRCAVRATSITQRRTAHSVTAIERRIPLVTTNLIIAETHRLTLFRAGLEPASRALERIDASPSVAIHFATSDDHVSARGGSSGWRRDRSPIRTP